MLLPATAPLEPVMFATKAVGDVMFEFVMVRVDAVTVVPSDNSVETLLLMFAPVCDDWATPFINHWTVLPVPEAATDRTVV